MENVVMVWDGTIQLTDAFVIAFMIFSNTDLYYFFFT